MRRTSVRTVTYRPSHQSITITSCCFFFIGYYTNIWVVTISFLLLAYIQSDNENGESVHLVLPRLPTKPGMTPLNL